MHKDQRVKGGSRPTFQNTMESKTKQEFAQETDVNYLMRRLTLNDMQMLTLQKGGQYMDVSNVGDYAEMVEHQQHIRDEFMKIPASIRRKFNNDPGEMIKLLQSTNEKDVAYSYEIGLRVKPKKNNQEIISQLEKLNESLSAKK